MVNLEIQDFNIQLSLMKKSSALLFLCFLINAACAQKQPARLLVRGDDMGYSHSGNEALIKSYQSGIQKSVEIIVPSPWFPEAVKLLKQNPGLDVGIHLAITSEWDNIKWRPLTSCPSIVNSDGYFYPMINPNKNYPGQSVSENKWTIQDIEKEFRAQIELALKHLPNITHVSAHMGCTYFHDDVQKLIARLCKEYKLLNDATDHAVSWVGYAGPHKTKEEKIASFIKMLDQLEPGKTYLFLDHPGFDNEELRAIHHIGYEDVAADRQGVTDLFTSEQVKTAITQKGIQLISYKDLLLPIGSRK